MVVSYARGLCRIEVINGIQVDLLYPSSLKFPKLLGLDVLLTGNLVGEVAGWKLTLYRAISGLLKSAYTIKYVQDGIWYIVYSGWYMVSQSQYQNCFYASQRYLN